MLDPLAVNLPQFMKWLGDVGMEYKDRWHLFAPEHRKTLEELNGFIDFAIAKLSVMHDQELDRLGVSRHRDEEGI